MFFIAAGGWEKTLKTVHLEIFGPFYFEMALKRIQVIFLQLSQNLMIVSLLSFLQVVNLKLFCQFWKSKQKQFHDCNSCKELIVNIWLNWRNYWYILYLFPCIENWNIKDFWSPEKILSNYNYVHPPAAKKKTGFYGPIGQRKNKIKYVRAIINGM